jgi:hypothetical protein
MPMSYEIESMTDLVSYLDILERRINDLEVENSDLRTQMNASERRGLDVIAFVKENWPRTGLVSPSFWMRALTVYGHFIVIQLVISILLLILGLVIFAPSLAEMIKPILAERITP